MTYMHFCDRFAAMRKERNLSQDALAKELNVTRKTICGWESNRCLPNFDSIIALAYAFGVSTDYILGLTDDPTSAKH